MRICYRVIAAVVAPLFAPVFWLPVLNVIHFNVSMVEGGSCAMHLQSIQLADGELQLGGGALIHSPLRDS